MASRLCGIAYQKDRLTVRVVSDGGLRQREIPLLSPRVDRGAHEHARQELVLRIADERLRLEVTGGRIDERIDGSDLPHEVAAGEGIRLHVYRLANGNA